MAGTGYDIVFLRYLNRIQEAMSTRQFNIQAWSSKRRSVLRHKPVTRAHVISRCFCEGIRGGESLSLSVFLLPFPSALCSITPHLKLILPQSFLPFLLTISLRLCHSLLLFFFRNIHVKPAFSPSCLLTLLKFLHPALSSSSVSHLFSLPSFFHPYLGLFLSP